MSKAEGNALPFFERPDLSPFLVHLTRNTEAKDGFTAFMNLVSILLYGEVRGSGKDGFIKGPHKAACFMDVPLSSLKYVLNQANTEGDRPRYEAYGIVILKSYAYEQGCRPVLYLSDKETSDLKIPDDELWRVVRLEAVDGTGVNWIHEREWRAKGNFILPQATIAVLVQSTEDATRLEKLINKGRGELKSIPSAIIPLEVLCQGLPYLSPRSERLQK